MKRRRPKPPPKRKSCDGKKRHSRESAHEEAERWNELMEAKGKTVRYNHYYCRYCNFFHVGRKPQYYSRGSYKENFSRY